MIFTLLMSALSVRSLPSEKESAMCYVMSDKSYLIQRKDCVTNTPCSHFVTAERANGRSHKIQRSTEEMGKGLDVRTINNA